MPTEPGPAGGPGPGPAPIRFTGTARDYFGIWLNNLALTVLTLGVYGAWAKVRRTRYFLGNTVVLGDGLEYHATGMTILKGRLVAVAAAAVYAASGFVSPTVQLALTAALVPAWPWVVNRALKFRARMTSWRNVRLDWRGRYWGVARVTLLWPLVSIATLGVLLPFAARAGRQYLIDNHALGQERFAARSRVGPYYGALAKTVLYGAALLAAGVVLATLWAASDFLPAAERLVGLQLTPFLAVAVMGMAAVHFRILARNAALRAMTLGEAARFRSDVGALRHQWILASNFAVTIVTAFLMHPWARIRAYRYQAERIAVEPLGAVPVFFDGDARPGHAIGEEFGAIEGVELGL